MKLENKERRNVKGKETKGNGIQRINKKERGRKGKLIGVCEDI